MSASWADRTLRSLPLRRKAAQLVMPRIGGEYVPFATGAWERMRHWVQDLGVGGIIVTIGPPLELAAKLNMLQSMAGVPLLVAADMEHGPGQVLNGGVVLPYGFENGGGTRFPPLMALGAAGDEDLAYELGRITAVEARAVGVHVAFAPVVDVNSNPANPIINTRSYSSDPTIVSRMGASHVRGLQEHGMLATAKHFPGHGDADADSHVELPIIRADRDRFDAVELAPFRAAFAAGVGGVMCAHIACPAFTGDTTPATLSGRVVTDLLRLELGFDGIVFTDALDMGAVVERSNGVAAAVRALQAGADVLLQPPADDVSAVVDGLVEAVHSGAVTEERLDTSVLRVLRTKERMSLQHGACIELERVSQHVGIEMHLSVARAAAERSITAVRNRAGTLPVRSARILVILYTAAYDPLAGRHFVRELACGTNVVDSIAWDGRLDRVQVEEITARAAAADAVILAAFIPVIAGNTALTLPLDVVHVLNQPTVRDKLVVVAFGNPYLLDQMPDIDTYVIAWAPWEPLQTAAARALLGRATISGRLPIPLPPHHPCGDGLDISTRPVS